jgi:hypothetical protein
MVRTLNLHSALAKMAGELSRRLKQSHVAGWRGKLLVADARERVALAIGRGRVAISSGGASRHAIRGGEEIARLLIGSDHPGEVMDAGAIRAAGDAAAIAEVLFPAQHPMLNAWDKY